MSENKQENIQSHNPLVDSLRIPGETFRLPSGGIFYKNGELDPTVENGEVHVYPMTTIDEIVMRSPDKLFSGEAIREVIQRCVPQVLKPFELFGKDIDFLTLVLRKVSFGNTIEITYDHGCKEDSKNHRYALNLNEFIRKTKKIDPTTINRKFETTIEDIYHVVFHPMKFGDYVKTLQSIDDNMTEEQIRDETVKSLTNVIKSVKILKSNQIVTEHEFIYEWVDKLPIKWKKQLSSVFEESSDWGADFITTAKCEDCGKEIRLSLPLNPVIFFS